MASRVQRGHASDWRQDKGQRPGAKGYPAKKIASPGSSFTARKWGADKGYAKDLYLDNPKRHAPSKPSKPQGHQEPERTYLGRTNYGVTDDRNGGFANHTDSFDPRAKSYHELSGVGGEAFNFHGRRK